MGNDEDDCNTPDSYLGFGLFYGTAEPSSAGNYRVSVNHINAIGYIMAR